MPSVFQGAERGEIFEPVGKNHRPKTPQAHIGSHVNQATDKCVNQSARARTGTRRPLVQNRQDKIEGTAGARLGLKADAAAVLLNDRPGNIQAQTRAAFLS